MTSLALVRPTERPAQPIRRQRRVRLPRIGERGALTIVSVVFYVTLGAVLVFHYDSVMGDALARVSDGHAVLFSRDPKLAAVGFVWTPLPVLLMLPLMPLKFLWPALTARGFLANIESGIAMAVAVGLLATMLREWGVRRAPRLMLVAAFALHPMIILYGANGMTEALFILCMLAVVRRLTNWMTTGATWQLAMSGVFLALAYLARYEAIVGALACVVVVLMVSFTRASGAWGERRSVAVADCLIVGLPPAMAFIGWSVTSWAIVGSPFEQFTSNYGNSAQLAAFANGMPLSARRDPIKFLIRQVTALEPLILLLLVLIACYAVARWTPRVLAILAGTGSVLAVQLLLFATGHTFQWLRFKIFVVPMTVLLVGCLLSARVRREPDEVLLAPKNGWWMIARAASSIALVAVVCGPPLLTATKAMTSPELSREEAQHLPGALSAKHDPKYVTGTALGQFSSDRQVAAYIDNLAAPDGSVLVDYAVGFGVVVSAQHPRRFIIDRDRDFQAALADPASFHVRYILVTSGYQDAVSRAYPTLYSDGANIATLVHTWPDSRSRGIIFRLYHVKPLT
ncbi:MAG: hypothetical protein ABJA34_11275 [Pseudonocardiales bacterium]